MNGPAEPQSAVQVRIHGRVQGVWFRAWTTQEAISLGLAGWVRNRADGSVEALFVGPAADVEAMIAKCHAGPPAAQVDEVVREVLSSSEVKLSAGGFRQLPTA